jgi:hypothetical protein
MSILAALMFFLPKSVSPKKQDFSLTFWVFFVLIVLFFFSLLFLFVF